MGDERHHAGFDFIVCLAAIRKHKLMGIVAMGEDPMDAFMFQQSRQN